MNIYSIPEFNFSQNFHTATKECEKKLYRAIDSAKAGFHAGVAKIDQIAKAIITTFSHFLEKATEIKHSLTNSITNLFPVRAQNNATKPEEYRSDRLNRAIELYLLKQAAPPIDDNLEYDLETISLFPELPTNTTVDNEIPSDTLDLETIVFFPELNLDTTIDNENLSNTALGQLLMSDLEISRSSTDSSISLEDETIITTDELVVYSEKHTGFATPSNCILLVALSCIAIVSTLMLREYCKGRITS